jgi:hypothetical protein
MVATAEFIEFDDHQATSDVNEGGESSTLVVDFRVFQRTGARLRPDLYRRFLAYAANGPGGVSTLRRQLRGLAGNR